MSSDAALRVAPRDRLLGELLLDARLALLMLPGVDQGSLMRADALVALTWHPNALVSLALSGDIPASSFDLSPPLVPDAFAPEQPHPPPLAH